MCRVISALILIFSIQCLDCTVNGPDLGTYYQDSFLDSVSVVIQADSIRLIVEQFGPGQPERKNIVYEIQNLQSLNDTLKLILKVNFGSYSPNPDPVKSIKIMSDTLYLWYASRKKPEGINLHKLNSGPSSTAEKTSPKLDYYSIEKAIVKGSSVKKFSFESRFYD